MTNSKVISGKNYPPALSSTSCLVQVPVAESFLDCGGRDAALDLAATPGTGEGSESAAGGGALHNGKPLRQDPTHQEITYDVDAWDIHFEKSPKTRLQRAQEDYQK